MDLGSGTPKQRWLPDFQSQNENGRNAETPVLSASGAPSGIRTRVTGLKGRRPRPG